MAKQPVSNVQHQIVDRSPFVFDVGDEYVYAIDEACVLFFMILVLGIPQQVHKCVLCSEVYYNIRD